MNPNAPIRIQRCIRGRCHSTAHVRKRIRAGTLPRYASALALFALCAGCASEVELSRIDPSLTDTDLRQGKVAVLGVVKFQEPDQVRPPLIAMLERTFRDERHDVPLIGADSVRQMLGPERHRRLLLAYECRRSLSPDDLAEISDSLRGAAKFIL